MQKDMLEESWISAEFIHMAAISGNFYFLFSLSLTSPHVGMQINSKMTRI